MKNFIITVSTSALYALIAESEREAIAEVVRHRDGWGEGVTDLGGGPTVYTVQESRP